MPDANRDRLLKEAAELARKGKLEQAVRQYEEALTLSPEDWQTANLAGDLCLRMGDQASAARLFRQAGDLLADEGFHAKAAAIFKKVLKILPEDEHARLKAGEIAERQELFADADAHFRVVASVLRKRGDEDGAAAIDARMKRGDPAEEEPTPTPTPVPVATAVAVVAAEPPAEAAVEAAVPSPVEEPAGSVELLRNDAPPVAAAPAAADPPMVVVPQAPPPPRIEDLRATLDDGTVFVVPPAPAGGDTPSDPESWRAALGATDVDGFAPSQPTAAGPLDLAVIDDSFILEGGWRDVVRRGARPEWLRDAAERAAASVAPPMPDLPPPAAIDAVMSDDADDAAVFEQVRTAIVAAHALQAQGWFSDGQRRLAAGDLAGGLPVLARASSAISVRGDAAGLLGRHYLATGEPQLALSWLERAAEAGTSDPDAGQALVYDIGCALQNMGEDSRAFAVLSELRRDVGGPWRDLDDRLGRLSGLPA